MNMVRKIRRDKDITQMQLAAAAGVSQPFLVDLEQGRRGARFETWQRIAKALGVTVEELKGGDNNEASDCGTSG